MTLRLNAIDERNALMIQNSGFASNLSEAIRASLAFMALNLAQAKFPSAPSPTEVEEELEVHQRVQIADSQPDEAADTGAVRDAIALVEHEQCSCRVTSGRHQLLLEMLYKLATGEWVAWNDVLKAAKARAMEFNQTHGLPNSSAPGSIVYTPAAMNQRWMRGFVDEGARFGERYSSSGPSVLTEERAGWTGVEIRLARVSEN